MYCRQNDLSTTRLRGTHNVSKSPFDPKPSNMPAGSVVRELSLRYLSTRSGHEGEYVELGARTHTVWTWSLLQEGDFEYFTSKTSIQLETSSEKLEIPTPSVLWTFPEKYFLKGNPLTPRWSQPAPCTVHDAIPRPHLYQQTSVHETAKVYRFGLPSARGWQLKGFTVEQAFSSSPYFKQRKYIHYTKRWEMRNVEPN